MPVTAGKQRRELARVHSAIGKAVIEFVRGRAGREFTGAELDEAVRAQCKANPGSALRIMRELRNAGHIDVELVSRSGSLYRVAIDPGRQTTIFDYA